MASGKTFFMVPVGNIVADISESLRPESEYTPNECATLIGSIIIDGFRTDRPIVVKRNGDGRYKVVDGYRRFFSVQLINNRVSFRTFQDFIGELPCTLIP